MASTVYNSRAIQLQDGTDVTLVPLAIGRLRRFMDEWAKFSEVETEKDALDIYINCCGISLEKQLSEKFEKTADDEKVLAPEYREFLEDVLDMETIFLVLDICGGLKLNDPKALEEAQKRLEEAAPGGTN